MQREEYPSSVNRNREKSNAVHAMPAFYLLLILFFAPSQTTQCAELEWEIGYFGFLDNREYRNRYVGDGTFFGGRPSIEAGIGFSDRHRIRMGIDILQEFGTPWWGIDNAGLIAYYEMEGRPVGVRFGIFPRNRVLKYPKALFSDSLNYYRPNMEGLALDAKWGWGYQNVWMDWTGRMSHNVRESFLTGFSGRMSSRFLFFSHHFVYYHVSHSVGGLNQGVIDNLGATVDAGINLLGGTVFDSLGVGGGVIGSYAHTRYIRPPVSKESRLGGFVGLGFRIFRKFGFETLYYSGEPQVFKWGSGFYQSRSFADFCLFALPVENENVQTRFDFALHLIDGRLDATQRFYVCVDITGSRRLHSRASEES